MASSSRSPTPTKRLLKELQTYQEDPNDALLHLAPVSDDSLSHWQAVMKGVPGTAYEGKTEVPRIKLVALQANDQNQVAAGFSTSSSHQPTQTLLPQ